MRSPLPLLALALPVLGLAAAWGWTDWRARQGTEWEVLVDPSGPRASLRGRYLVFRYAWNLPDAVDPGSVQALCLEGTPPTPSAVRATTPDDPTCRHLVRAGNAGGAGGTRFSGVQGGVLYVPQEQVPAIRRQLADRTLTALARIRVSDSGVITPLRVRFVDLNHFEQRATRHTKVTASISAGQSGLPSLSR